MYSRHDFILDDVRPAQHKRNTSSIHHGCSVWVDILARLTFPRNLPPGIVPRPRSDYFFTNVYDLFYCNQQEGDGNLNEASLEAMRAQLPMH
jgi:hypothetical protein